MTRYVRHVSSVALIASSCASSKKTDKDNPKWYMVDVTFVARTAHFVPLALLRRIAGAATDDTPEDIGYIHSDGVKAIKREYYIMILHIA